MTGEAQVGVILRGMARAHVRVKVEAIVSAGLMVRECERGSTSVSASAKAITRVWAG